MSKWYLVDTDNFGGDYPDERFLKTFVVGKRFETTRIESEAFSFSDEGLAGRVAKSFNQDDMQTRCVKVVREGYQLQPGFEP